MRRPRGSSTSARPRRPRRVSSDRSSSSTKANSSAASEAATDVGPSLLPTRRSHLQRLVVQQRGEGELAEHQRDRDERGRRESPARCWARPPARSRSTSRRPATGRPPTRVCTSIADSARVDRPVGERQHQDDVDEGQRERRVAEEVGDPRRRRSQMPTTITSAGMVSGSRQRNSTSPLAQGTRSRTQIIVGTSSASISTHGEQREQQRGDDRGAQRVVLAPGSSRPPGCDRLAASVAGAEVEHREQREQEEQPRRRTPSSDPRKPCRPCWSAAHRSHRAVRRSSRA